MIFGRRRGQRYREIVERQLDLLAADEPELVADADQALERYTAAGRDEAEELYADYALELEALADRLAEMRDTYAATLAEREAAEYAAAFDRGAARRWPGVGPPLAET